MVKYSILKCLQGLNAPNVNSCEYHNTHIRISVGLEKFNHHTNVGNVHLFDDDDVSYQSHSLSWNTRSFLKPSLMNEQNGIAILAIYYQLQHSWISPKSFPGTRYSGRNSCVVKNESFFDGRGNAVRGV